MAVDICNSCMLFWDLKRSDCTSWVQAWGTILAVGVAIYVPWNMHRKEQQAIETAKIQQKIERLAGWYQLLHAAAEKAKACREVADNPTLSVQWLDNMISELTALIDASERLDITVLNGYHKELEPVVTGTTMMRAMRAHVEQAKATTLNLHPAAAYLHKAVAEMHQELLARADSIDKRLKEVRKQL